jgi:DNA-binding MarR family transcriptional regulator
MPKQTTDNLFLQEKPTLALLTIWARQKTYASVVTKEINSTFAHTTKILSKMEEMGLVRFTMDGRIKYVELTDYGTEVVESMRNLILSLETSLPQEYMAVVEREDDLKHHSLNAESEKILGKINNIRTKIDKSYAELVKKNANEDTIRMRLGPFSREIAIIGNMIENSEEPIHDDVLIAYSNTEDVFNSILKKD